MRAAKFDDFLELGTHKITPIRQQWVQFRKLQKGLNRATLMGNLFIMFKNFQHLNMDKPCVYTVYAEALGNVHTDLSYGFEPCTVKKNILSITSIFYKYIFIFVLNVFIGGNTLRQILL